MNKKLLVSLLAVVVITIPVGLALSQGAGGEGVFVRVDCTTIVNPITNKTWCFDTSVGKLKYWNGTVYVVITSPSGLSNLSFSASIPIDSSQNGIFRLSIATGTAFTIANPTNPTTGQRIVITIRNTATNLGTITWDTSYKLATGTFVKPVIGYSKSVEFVYDGTNWVELWRSATDVGN